MPTGTVAQYKYDALGRRIEKNVNGVLTRYLYDGYNILAEYDDSGNQKARYTHNLAIDDPLAMERGGQVYYYHKDALGSITALTDVNGQVAQTYEYDSFGSITNQVGNVENPYTYTGREYDPETGLYYLRARYYDARAGRFINEDPIGLEGGINIFAYAENSPINFNDPYGLLAAEGLLSGGVFVEAWETTGATAAGTAVAGAAGVIASGLGSYYLTSKLIEGTWLGGGLGEWIYNKTHSEGQNKCGTLAPSGPTFPGKKTPQKPEDCNFQYQYERAFCDNMPDMTSRAWCKFKALVHYIGCLTDFTGI